MRAIIHPIRIEQGHCQPHATTNYTVIKVKHKSLLPPCWSRLKGYRLQVVQTLVHMYLNHMDGRQVQLDLRYAHWSEVLGWIPDSVGWCIQMVNHLWHFSDILVHNSHRIVLKYEHNTIRQEWRKHGTSFRFSPSTKTLPKGITDDSMYQSENFLVQIVTIIMIEFW